MSIEKTEHPSHTARAADDVARVPFWRVILSVIQACFGVQSSKNRQRDFGQGNYVHYIITAVILAVVFVGTLLVVVNLVLNQ